MKHKYILRIATPADAMTIANIYLASRKKFVSFAQLKHSDETIYQWILQKLIPTNLLFIAEDNDKIEGSNTIVFSS